VAIENGAPLLERERELALLGKVLTEARRGRGQVVLIEAPAGLGKTSLLRAATDKAAAAGFACLRARASELERDFAYGCVRQLLEPVVAKGSDPERDGLFEGAAALSRPLFAHTGATPPLRWSDASFSILHGLYWLLSNLADKGPVVLSVDDLHWSDTESLRFLDYLAPRLDGLPLAVVGSARSGEYGAADLARLATAPETTVLRPRPLSVEATATLCQRRLGMPVADRFAAACWQATAGNPFYLQALLREVEEQKYPTDARGAAKVEGGAHARAAVLLGASGAGEERIAAQIVEAEPTGDADRVELLRRVGADALARGAPAAAVAWYERALAEPPPPATKAEVLLELGSAELRLGAATAVDHLTAAVELLSEPEPLATSVRLLANALTIAGNADRAVEALVSAIDVVAPKDRELSLLLEGELATHALQAGLKIINSGDTITVRLERRAYAPVLRKASLPAQTTVPWWGNRTLHYEFA
jgi:hypothetical protein